MKIAKIAAVAMTVLCAVSFVSSCQKEKKEEPVAPKEADFTVALGSVEAEYAEVVVRHTGAKDATWFGFVTDDVTTPEQDLINAQLAQLDRKALHVGKAQTVAVRNLQEYVVYRYVAFAVDESNQTYGKAGSITFSTSPKYNVVFTAEAASVESHKASFNVSHEGHQALTWMAFVTEDLKTEADVLAAAHYATLVNNGTLAEGVELYGGNAQTVTVEELTHETTYRFIVYGLFVEGDTAVYYGTPADIQITTPIDLSIVNFSAAISGITKNSAKATVSYDAKKEDLTWYGFVTEDLTSPATTLIAAAVQGVSAEQYGTGSGKVVELTDLQVETDYRYIVTGINADGTYGVQADVKFSTLSQAYDQTVFSVAATEVKPKEATLTITHTGLDDFEYYGFLTDDMTSALADVAVPETADANLMKGKEKTVTLENLSAITKYRYVVVGRVNGNEYGTRGEVVFTTGDYAVAASYQDFLGAWSMTQGTTYEFSIEQKVAGESYIISGLNGSETANYGIDTPLKVEGKFADGKFTIAIQAISDVYVDPEDNKSYTDMFCGMYTAASDGKTYYDKTTGQVVVTFAMLEDGTIELRPGKTQGGDTYTSMRFYQVPTTGSSAYAQDSFGTQLPNAAKHAAVASEAYNKWLGDWTIGGVNMHIAKKETNVSYQITGFYSSFYGELTFDAATGNAVFNHKKMDYTVNSSTGVTYDMYTTGINSLNYVAVRDESDPSLAIFSLNSAGTSGTVTGVTYTHSEGQTTVTEIGLFGYASSWTKWTGWNYLTLPCNIAKASGTSSIAAPAAFNAIPGVGVQTVSVRRSKEADKSYCRNQK